MHPLSRDAQITNGLDAATALDICAFLSAWAHTTGGTVITALQAPTPEAVAAFDDVIVLSEGHILYHGPPASLVPYLASAGFPCPSYEDVADFAAQLAMSAAMTVQLYGADFAAAGAPPVVADTAAGLAAHWKQVRHL
jgi:ABC-type multidrug transport system ATPase subunit